MRTSMHVPYTYWAARRDLAEHNPPTSNRSPPGWVSATPNTDPLPPFARGQFSCAADTGEGWCEADVVDIALRSV